MRVLAAYPEELAWLANRTDAAFTPGARAIKAVDATGRIRGMVAYDGWTVSACQAHMAVDSPIVWRSLVRPAFSYPFEEAGKSLILGIVPGDNAKSLAMVEALGFREVHRVKDGWAPGVPLVVHEMRREECVWLKPVRRLERPNPRLPKWVIPADVFCRMHAPKEAS